MSLNKLIKKNKRYLFILAIALLSGMTIYFSVNYQSEPDEVIVDVLPETGSMMSELVSPVNVVDVRQPFKGSAHHGIDLVYTDGDGNKYGKIYSSGDGRVVERIVGFYEGDDCGYGNTAPKCNYGHGNQIIIKHRDNVYTSYSHLRENEIFVDNYEHVTKDTHIANVGATGNASNAHLHFELRHCQSYTCYEDPTAVVHRSRITEWKECGDRCTGNDGCLDPALTCDQHTGGVGECDRICHNGQVVDGTGCLCINPPNEPTNTPVPTATSIPLNTFRYEFDRDGWSYSYYCKEQIPTCESQGMKYLAFSDNANYSSIMIADSICVKSTDCASTSSGVCKTHNAGKHRYLFCKEILQVTNTPTATPIATAVATPTSTPIITAIATPTATPIGTPANTPTITPTPDNSNSVKCGPMDSYNIAGKSDGDGLITGNDFTAFANMYGKTCNDDNVDYGKCGGKNRILYDGDHKVDVHDLVYFAAVFNEPSCDINDLYVLPQTGGEVKIDSINYTVIVLLEIITTMIILFGTYNYKKYHDERK